MYPPHLQFPQVTPKVREGAIKEGVTLIFCEGGQPTIEKRGAQHILSKKGHDILGDMGGEEGSGK